jgi:hypothetical protein
MHALGQRQIAFVGEWCVYELRCISLIFISVIELGVYHAYYDHGRLLAYIESQLFLPGPIIQALAITRLELLNDVYIVNDVHDEGFVFQLHEIRIAFGLVFDIRVFVECRLELTKQACQIVFRYASFARLSEYYRFGQAQNLVFGIAT